MNFENQKFLKLYKFLFDDEEFSKLSIEEKVIYSMMLERNNLSIKNNLKDNSGYYIIMTNREIQSILNCGNQKAVKVLNNLELVNLIQIKKQGLNKPDLIYLKSHFLKCENHNPRNIFNTIKK